MKNFLSLLTIIALITVIFSINVFAANESVWTKYKSKTYEEITQDGEKIYAIGGFTANYSTPGLEIGSIIKEKANSESVTITISFDARVNYVDDNDPIEVQLDAIFRGENLADILTNKETMKDVWEDNYEGSFFKYVNGGNIMAYGFKGARFTLNEEWQKITFEFVLFQEDLGIGLFDKWYFCFQNYNPIDAIECLEFKNTVVTVTGEGETPAKTPAENAVGEDTRPVITKNPEKTIAPDSALSAIIANSCNCEQNSSLNILLPTIISSISLLVSIIAIVLVIRKKK